MSKLFHLIHALNVFGFLFLFIVVCDLVIIKLFIRAKFILRLLLLSKEIKVESNLLLTASIRDKLAHFSEFVIDALVNNISAVDS